MYCKLEFPHSPDAQMCTAIVVIQIQEHLNHYDYNYGEILPDNLNETCPFKLIRHSHNKGQMSLPSFPQLH